MLLTVAGSFRSFALNKGFPGSWWCPSRCWNGRVPERGCPPVRSDKGVERITAAPLERAGDERNKESVRERVSEQERDELIKGRRHVLFVYDNVSVKSFFPAFCARSFSPAFTGSEP